MEEAAAATVTRMVATRSYSGKVWHDPTIAYPTDAQMYVCVSDGCPAAGAAEMKCQVRYSVS